MTQATVAGAETGWISFKHGPGTRNDGAVTDDDVPATVHEASGDATTPKAPPSGADENESPEKGGRETPEVPHSKSHKVEWAAVIISILTAIVAVVAIIVQSNSTT